MRGPAGRRALRRALARAVPRRPRYFALYRPLAEAALAHAEAFVRRQLPARARLARERVTLPLAPPTRQLPYCLALARAWFHTDDDANAAADSDRCVAQATGELARFPPGYATTPDESGGKVEAMFTSLYGDYFGACQRCHVPGAPGRTREHRADARLQHRATALSTLKTDMATELVGNHTACNGVPLLAATPGKTWTPTARWTAERTQLRRTCAHGSLHWRQLRLVADDQAALDH